MPVALLTPPKGVKFYFTFPYPRTQTLPWTFQSMPALHLFLKRFFDNSCFHWIKFNCPWIIDL